jgi:putative DNA primase/helicase
MSADPVPLRGHAGVPEVTGDHLNANRFLSEHGHGLRRSPELGRWFIWNGACWSEDRLDRVPALASATIDGLRPWVAEAVGVDEFKRRSAHYAASAKAGRRDALLSIVGTDPDVVVSVEQLDAHPLLLACRNGTVDLTTGDLRPADPAHLLTRGVDVDYSPDDHSARWERFIDEIFGGDLDLIAFVQRLLGYCLTGVVAEHVVPVLTGTGANGKSTLIGVVQDLLGDHAITAPEGLIIQRGYEPHPERLAVLRGRRMVVSSELEESAVLAEGVAKMLSGGDTISARELYGRRFNFRPTHKLLLVTNHRPRVHGVDVAIWRRLRVIPFRVTFPADRQDPTLRRRFVEEDAAAVMAWLVEGAVAWNREGIGDAPAVKAATHEYRQSQDTIGAWLDECTVTREGNRTKVGELFVAWCSWCKQVEERPGRHQDFAKALESHGIAVESYRNNRLARGIDLLVSAREDSTGYLPISNSTGTLRVSAHESSQVQVGGPLPTDAELERMFPEEAGTMRDAGMDEDEAGWTRNFQGVQPVEPRSDGD